MNAISASQPKSDAPSDWVSRFAPLIPAGEVLDLACGNGRHARLLAGLGHPVLALDRDPDALVKTAGERILTLLADLEGDGSGSDWPFAANRFAGIVVTNYLHRPLFPFILASLAPQGILIYETFALGNAHYGKPTNPDFLLAPGELLDLMRIYQQFSLRIVAYEDGYVAAPKPAMVQRICVIKAPTAFSSANSTLF